jgi:phosphoenolpyruvate-protein kinase (PTS system EI component)
MANLKLQGSTWHVRLTVPKDLRDKYGNKGELWQSTGTGNKKLADIVGAEIVADWKREFYAARNGINVQDWAKSWAKEVRKASPVEVEEGIPSDRDAVEFILIDELEELIEKRQLTEPEAKAAYEVATGKRVVLRDYKDDYLKQYRNHNIKTQAAYRAAVERFVTHFHDCKQVTNKSLKQWVIDMAEVENLSAKTIARMIQQTKSFWAYLVEHEIVTSDVNPSTGFKLNRPGFHGGWLV